MSKLDDIEIALLCHNDKHERKMSIKKDEEDRLTFCPKCNAVVLFKRKDHANLTTDSWEDEYCRLSDLED